MLALALAAEGGVVVLLLALAVVGTLHALPGELLAQPPFTLAYGGVSTAASLWLLWRYARWRRARPYGQPPIWVRAAGGAVLAPLLTIGLIAAVVYLKMPFWPPGPGAAVAADRPEQRPYSVYLVKHTWHTSVAARLQDLGPETLPDPGIRGRAWADFGWGDAGFFQSDVMTVPLTLDALLTPGPAVLHVGTFDLAPPAYFAGQPVVRLDVTADGMRRLAAFVRETYALDAAGKPVQTGHPGYYYRGDSYFVRATGSYYFPNTCNVWTARALRAAGVPVSPGLAVTAENLLFQASRVGMPLS